MIPVPKPIPEPPGFDLRCRQRGNQWLQDNPEKTAGFSSHWNEFEGDLERAFSERCGWWAMWIPFGTIDHFFSTSKPGNRNLIYEWNNYRFAAATLNSSKQDLDDRVLDPFEVQEGWFEVLLPSMQLIRSDAVPSQLREKADFTINRLQLVRGRKIRRNRTRWYENFKRNGDFEGLRRDAPLVAAAVGKLLIANLPLP